MAELLTRAIVEEYRKRAKALPDTAGQDIRERRELRIELQNRCGITELQAVNILNGFHADSYIVMSDEESRNNYCGECGCKFDWRCLKAIAWMTLPNPPEENAQDD